MLSIHTTEHFVLFSRAIRKQQINHLYSVMQYLQYIYYLLTIPKIYLQSLSNRNKSDYCL